MHDHAMIAMTVLHGNHMHTELGRQLCVVGSQFSQVDSWLWRGRVAYSCRSEGQIPMAKIERAHWLHAQGQGAAQVRAEPRRRPGRGPPRGGEWLPPPARAGPGAAHRAGAGLVRCGLNQQGIKIEVSRLVVDAAGSGHRYRCSSTSPEGIASDEAHLGYPGWVSVCWVLKFSGLLAMVHVVLSHTASCCIGCR